jgi:hypothetical protein
LTSAPLASAAVEGVSASAPTGEKSIGPIIASLAFKGNSMEFISSLSLTVWPSAYTFIILNKM